MSEFLYIAKCQTYYKIGIANDVRARLSTLQVGNPVKIEIVAHYRIADSKNIEALIHGLLSSKNIRGEWFELSKTELDGLLGVCSAIEAHEKRPTRNSDNATTNTATSITINGIDINREYLDKLIPSGRFCSDLRVERFGTGDNKGRYWQWRERKRNGRAWYGGTWRAT